MFVGQGELVAYWALMERVAEVNEILWGWVELPPSARQEMRVVLNPEVSGSRGTVPFCRPGARNERHHCRRLMQSVQTGLHTFLQGNKARSEVRQWRSKWIKLVRTRYGLISMPEPKQAMKLSECLYLCDWPRMNLTGGFL